MAISDRGNTPFRELDPELWETIRSMPVSEGLRIWFEKYPDDMPNKWKEAADQMQAAHQSQWESRQSYLAGRWKSDLTVIVFMFIGAIVLAGIVAVLHNL